MAKRLIKADKAVQKKEYSIATQYMFTLFQDFYKKSITISKLHSSKKKASNSNCRYYNSWRRDFLTIDNNVKTDKILKAIDKHLIDTGKVILTVEQVDILAKVKAMRSICSQFANMK